MAPGSGRQVSREEDPGGGRLHHPGIDTPDGGLLVVSTVAAQVVNGGRQRFGQHDQLGNGSPPLAVSDERQYRRPNRARPGRCNCHAGSSGRAPVPTHLCARESVNPLNFAADDR